MIEKNKKLFHAAFVKYAKLKTQATVAIELGRSTSYVNQVFRGKKNTSAKTQSAIAEKLGFSYEQFLNYGKDSKTPSPKAPTPITIQTRNSHEQNLLERTIPDYIGVPLYTSGRVAAWSNGAAFDQYDPPTSEVLVYTPELGHRAKHHLVAARVGGDSMEPLVPKNSIIIIDMDDKEFVDNKVFAVAIDEGGVKTLAVKRVRKAEEFKGFVLWSENHDYAPRVLVESDWLRLCVGRVVWMWRSFEG